MQTSGFSRAIIWGHKPRRSLGIGRWAIRSHTHSYIHAGYAKAFQYLGLETHWIDSVKELQGSSLEGALVFTEGQVDGELPVHAGASYVTHHSVPERYEGKVKRWLKLHNFVTDLENGVSYSYPDSPVEKIDAVTYFDSINNALYMPWATDLLPSDTLDPRQISRTDINYVGTVNHDGILPRYRIFRQSAVEAGFRVRNFEGVSNSRARELVQESNLVVDIRGDWHLQRGYIPCRIWKALSYGRALTSNSENLKSIFGDRIAFAHEGQNHFQVALGHELAARSQDLRDNQDWVMKNHTFVNRARTILGLL